MDDKRGRGKARKPPRAVMNGAARRLLKMRVRTESDMRLVMEAVNGFEAVIEALAALKIVGLDMQTEAIRHGVKVLRALHENLGVTNQEIRGSEQLAGEQSWRLQMQFDKLFAGEFLRLIEIPILREAVMDLDGGRLAELRGIFCDEAE